MFFLLILAGRVFGPGFGFVLGCTSLFASALMTAGVGPWLPYQMLVAAWVGMGAGLLPRRVTGRAEIAMLVVYGVVAAYAFGLLMNLSGWPFLLGIEVAGHEGSLAYVAGAPRRREPPAVPRLHAADLDRPLGHRPRDHQRGAARRARAGGADHPAARRRGGRRSDSEPTDQDPVVLRRAGSPRPSWLDVVTQRLPSGATTTVRSRPYFADEEVGRACSPACR